MSIDQYPRRVEWDSTEHHALVEEEYFKSDGPFTYTPAKADKILAEDFVREIDAYRGAGCSEEDIKEIFDEYDDSALKIFRYRLEDLLGRDEDSNQKTAPYYAKRVMGEAVEAGIVSDDFPNDLDSAQKWLDSLNDKDLEALARHHVEVETKNRPIYVDMIHEKIGKLLGQIRLTVSSGRLPELNSDDLSRRIASLKVVTIDEMAMLFSPCYSRTSHTIILPRTENPEEYYGMSEADDSDPNTLTMDYLLLHELLHGLEGKEVVYTKPYGRHEVKNGLTFLRFEKGKRSKSRFHWLEEAVTEVAAMRVMDVSQSPFYEKHRRVLHLIRTRGQTEIPEDLFLGAKFENFDLKAPRGSRLPKWKALRTAINDAFDPKFILEFDDMVSAYDEDMDIAIQFFEYFPMGSEYGANGTTLEEFRAHKIRELNLTPNATWKEVVFAEKYTGIN